MTFPLKYCLEASLVFFAQAQNVIHAYSFNITKTLKTLGPLRTLEDS